MQTLHLSTTCPVSAKALSATSHWQLPGRGSALLQAHDPGARMEDINVCTREAAGSPILTAGLLCLLRHAQPQRGELSWLCVGLWRRGTAQPDPCRSPTWHCWGGARLFEHVHMRARVSKQLAPLSEPLLALAICTCTAALCRRLQSSFSSCCCCCRLRCRLLQGGQPPW